jgi:hypothetical protein
LKHGGSVLLREMPEVVRDTRTEAPYIKDSFHPQEGSVIDALAICWRSTVDVTSDRRTCQRKENLL